MAVLFLILAFSYIFLQKVQHRQMDKLCSELKKPMYKSYCNLNSVGKSVPLDSSFVGLNNNKYKYERVGNIFKLVEVGENKENNRYQQKQSNERINKLQQLIDELTLRMEKMENMVPNINEKMDQLLIDMDSLTCTVDYKGNKAESALHQVNELRQRLEEIEQQEFKFDGSILEVSRKIEEVDEKYQLRIANMIIELSKSLQQIQEKLNDGIVGFQQKIKQSSLNTSDCSLSPTKQFHSSPNTYIIDQIHSYRYQGCIYKIGEVSYRIDGEGRLLDEDGYGILDSQNKEIRLTNEHLTKLRQFGILQQSE